MLQEPNISELLKQAIEKEMEHEFGKLINELVKNMNRKKYQIIAGASLRICERMSMFDHRDFLEIRIMKELPPNTPTP